MKPSFVCEVRTQGLFPKEVAWIYLHKDQTEWLLTPILFQGHALQSEVAVAEDVCPRVRVWFGLGGRSHRDVGCWHLRHEAGHIRGAAGTTEPRQDINIAGDTLNSIQAQQRGYYSYFVALSQLQYDYTIEHGTTFAMVFISMQYRLWRELLNDEVNSYFITTYQCNIQSDTCSSTFPVVYTRRRDWETQVGPGLRELLRIHMGLGPEAALQDDPWVRVVHSPGREQDMGSGPIDPAPCRLWRQQDLLSWL